MIHPRSLAVALTTALALRATAGSAQAAGLPTTARPVAGPSAAAGDRGTWAVEPLTANTYRLTWTSPTALPLSGDRPVIVPHGSRTGAEEVGRTLSDLTTRRVWTEVRSTSRPDPGAYDVVLSGRVLDAATGPESPRPPAPGPARPSSPSSPLAPALGVDPAKPGPYEVVTSETTAPARAHPGYKSPLEMVAHIEEPRPGSTPGRPPVVLFLHGRHSYCFAGQNLDGVWPCKAPAKPIPSHLGYRYVQRLLASQGYATVSISANAINAQDADDADSGAGARAALVIAHLDAIAATRSRDWDLSRVVLVGHSRGGEGVQRASTLIPLTAPYRIVGQVLLAPVNFSLQTTGYVPTVTVLPNCDGDVSDLQGQTYTDRARDLAAGDTALRSSVLVEGANHNYFNTEWTPGLAVAPANDDWSQESGTCSVKDPQRLTPQRQQQVGAALVAGAVRLFAGGESSMLPLFDGTPLSLPNVAGARLRVAALGGDRTLVRPRSDAWVAPGRTMPMSRICEGYHGSVPFGQVSCLEGTGAEERVPHWLHETRKELTRPAWHVRWSAAGQRAGLGLARPLDVRGRVVDARVIIPDSVASVAVALEITDLGGRTISLDPVAGSALTPVPGTAFEGLAHWVAGTIRFPALTAEVLAAHPGFDPKHVTTMTLRSVSRTGQIYVLDLSAYAGRLAPVPERRLPVLSVRGKSQKEGNTPAEAAVALPVTVRGSLPAPASVLTVSADWDANVIRRSVSTIDAGSTTATVYARYLRNTFHDLTRSLAVEGFALRGAMYADWTTRATILDDDPVSVVRVSSAASVRESSGVTITLTSTPAAGFEREYRVSFLTPTRGRELTLDDLEPGFRKMFFPALKATTPLSKTGAITLHTFPARRTSAIVRIPLRRDAVTKTETVRVRIIGPGVNGVVRSQTVVG